MLCLNVVICSELKSPSFGDANVERVHSRPSVSGCVELSLGTILSVDGCVREFKASQAPYNNATVCVTMVLAKKKVSQSCPEPLACGWQTLRPSDNLQPKDNFYNFHIVDRKQGISLRF